MTRSVIRALNVNASFPTRFDNTPHRSENLVTFLTYIGGGLGSRWGAGAEGAASISSGTAIGEKGLYDITPGGATILFSTACVLKCCLLVVEEVDAPNCEGGGGKFLFDLVCIFFFILGGEFPVVLDLF